MGDFDHQLDMLEAFVSEPAKRLMNPTHPIPNVDLDSRNIFFLGFLWEIDRFC